MICFKSGNFEAGNSLNLAVTARTLYTYCQIPRETVSFVFPRILASVVQRLDSAIHRINHYPVDSAISFPNTYPLDSDLSGG